MLRGRCRRCGAAIGRRAFLVEFGGAIIGAIALWQEPGAQGLLGALFGWQLLALGLFDAEHMRLPHGMTGSLAVTGLLAAAAGGSPDLVDRLLGGLSGFAALFLIASLYRAVRGREGLGGGDPPMLAAIGCWLGWQALPLVMTGAGIAGLGLILIRMAMGEKMTAKTAVPLGSLMTIPAFLIWCLV